MEGHSLEEQVAKLAQLVVNHENCVLVNLKINDHDLVRRRAAVWTDPVTNMSYPGQQVLYSRQRRHDGWIDGDEDTIYIQERLKNSVDRIILTPKLVEGESDETDDTPKLPQAPTIFRNQISYPILSEKILDRFAFLSYYRLIKLPENDPELVAKKLEQYEVITEACEALRKKYFNVLQVVELDATQHPEQVFDQISTQMQSRGYSIYHHLCEPTKLVWPEGASKGTII